MKFIVVTTLGAALLGAPCSIAAKDIIFSGPQPGERTTSFKSVHLVGPSAGQETDLIVANNGMPTLMVFVHGVERSMVPLMRVLDEYGTLRKDLLKTEFVFLSGDRLEAERRFPAVANSLRLQSRFTLSVDGVEGPGNYGLNKECLMTVIVAKENKVTANFALVQPGISDAAAIIDAIAKTCGDDQPPSVAQLEARRAPPAQAMARGGLPDAPKDNFPGAVPTDEKLLGLIRQFIRPTNDDRTVDSLLTEIESHIAGKPDLKKQTIDAWTRILHFEDRYGTAYARKMSKAFLERLQMKQ